MRRHSIYIAGPMTGIPELNRPAFNEVEKELTGHGYAVLNPAAMPLGLQESSYMDICLAMVRAADSLHMLKGWQNSEGAMTEYLYTKKLGKTIVEDSTGADMCHIGGLEMAAYRAEMAAYQAGQRDRLRAFGNAAGKALLEGTLVKPNGLGEPEMFRPSYVKPECE